MKGDRSASRIAWQMSMGVNLSSASDCLFASGTSLDLSHASVSPSAGGVGRTAQGWAALAQLAVADTGTVIKAVSIRGVPATLLSGLICIRQSPRFSLAVRGCGRVRGLF